MAAAAAPMAMMAAPGMAQAGMDVTKDAADSTTAALDTATNIVNIRPEDLPKKIPEMLNPQGNDVMSSMIRIAGAYERFHAAAAERLHPTDNLLNARYSSMMAEMFAELAEQVKVYFCNMFQKIFQQNGEQLKNVIILTVRNSLRQRAVMQEYLIPGIHSIILRTMDSPKTKDMVLRHLRGNCFVPEITPNYNMSSSDVAIFKGGRGASATPSPPPPPPPMKMSGGVGETPLVNIEYMDAPENLKKFICNAFETMFSDKWTSIRAVVMSSVEGMIRDNQEIKTKNQKMVINVIDVLFDAPRTKAEFVRHLTGGCSVPRQESRDRKIIYPKEYKLPDQEYREQMKNESPFQMFKKYGPK